MRNVVAERILGWFTEQDRAANIVGDLAETAQTRGAAWFWRSLLLTASRLAIRPAVIFAACIAVQLAAMWASASVMNAISRETHRVPMTGQLLAFSAVLLSSITLYTAFRDGLHRARLGAVLAVVTFAGGCLQRTPWVANGAAAVAVALILAAAASRLWRRDLARLMVAYALSAVALIALVMLANTAFLHRAALPFPVNYMLVVAMQWAACSWVRPAVAGNVNHS